MRLTSAGGDAAALYVPWTQNCALKPQIPKDIFILIYHDVTIHNISFCECWPSVGNSVTKYPGNSVFF